MSYIRPGSRKLFSNSENQGLYVYLTTSGVDGSDRLEDYGALNNPEDFCEVMFRILDQGGVDVTLEMVNKARERLHLDPLDELGEEYGKTEEFMDKVGNND